MWAWSGRLSGILLGFPGWWRGVGGRGEGKRAWQFSVTEG